MLHCVDDLMPIGEFSERSGLSPNRLRSYAAGGLLVPAAVDSASGYRYYSPGQLREAKVIDVDKPAPGALDDSIARKVAQAAKVSLPLGTIKAQDVSKAPK